MILYLNHKLNLTVWKPIPTHFNPRLDDFKNLYFRVDDVIYFEWNADFEAAVVWEKLNRKNKI